MKMILDYLISSPKTILKVLLVFVAIGAITLIALARPVSPVVTTRVTNTFTDVNGDGRIDLIVNGEVILNTNPLSLTASQP